MKCRTEVVWLIALLLLAVVSTVVYITVRSGVNLKVYNASQGSVRYIRIKWTGGSVYIPEIRAGEWFSVKVRSKGESDLSIEFTDALGILHVSPIDVYFESHSHGVIYIRIEQSGDVTWKDDIVL